MAQRIERFPKEFPSILHSSVEARYETHVLSEFRPECLKNVQYLKILNPNRQWTLGYQMRFFGKNASI